MEPGQELLGKVEVVIESHPSSDVRRAIQTTWDKYLNEYGDPEKIVSALEEIIIYEKLDDALIKLQEEGKIGWVGTDSKLRAKAQYLKNRGLAVYKPEWPPSGTRWELNKFKSLVEFHQTISKLIKGYRVKFKEEGKPLQSQEDAYVVLEELRKARKIPKPVTYERKESNSWGLYQVKN
jgi:hypothetical protein